MSYPMLRHNYKCQDSRCEVCLEDSNRLLSFLQKNIGSKGDLLGQYRYWLDNTKKYNNPETEYGWFDPGVFEPKILDEFIEDLKSKFNSSK